MVLFSILKTHGMAVEHWYSVPRPESRCSRDVQVPSRLTTCYASNHLECKKSTSVGNPHFFKVSMEKQNLSYMNPTPSH